MPWTDGTLIFHQTASAVNFTGGLSVVQAQDLPSQFACVGLQSPQIGRCFYGVFDCPRAADLAAVSSSARLSLPQTGAENNGV